MSNISIDEVKKLAHLSRISMTDEELKEFTTQIDDILGYVKKLEAVDTSGVEPTSQVTGLTNVARTDEQKDYKVTPAELIANTPDSEDGYIKTKRIIK